MIHNIKIIYFIVFIVDQISKIFIFKFIDYGSQLNIISCFNFFNITNIHNSGGIFGIYSNNNNIFLIIYIFFFIILFIFFYKNIFSLNSNKKHAFSLIIFGGLSNFFDRLFYKFVIDFLDFGIYSIRWPSFNIADTSICIGIIILLFDEFVFDKR
jgi:signal peptidase II